MSSILSILRAAHCRSTHHYFALDALRDLKTAQAQRLANLLLKYHDDYLVGAKAPDCNFKDFQNHVIHVKDNYWGGAAKKCEQWLAEARQHLDRGHWKKAAYACGVLSHYFTDPIMPLHTGQTVREAAIHRPLEWSIYQSYEQILEHAEQKGLICSFTFAADQQWISKAVVAAAQVANRHYESLIDSFDLNRAAIAPREGLTPESLPILAELFALSIGGLSQVLTRLADETIAELPQVSLTITAILATIDKPLAWIVRRISNASERRAVQSIIAEVQSHGTLTRHLPPEVAVVQKARIAQPELNSQPVEVATDSTMAHSQSLPLALEDSRSSRTDEGTIQADLHPRRLDTIIPPTPIQDYPAKIQSEQLATTDDALAQIATEPPNIQASGIHSSTDTEDEQDFMPLSQAIHRLRIHRPSTELADAAVETTSLAPVASVTDGTSDHDDYSNSDNASAMMPVEVPVDPPRIAIETLIAEELSALESVDHPSEPKVHYESPLIDAPSIGPKTAKRFEKIGIATIGQFVSVSAAQIVRELDTRWITETLVQDWQDQARLICEVPALTGYRAQLLVAIGYRNAWQLRTASASALHSQLKLFCQTSEGQQILRSAHEPSLNDVIRWIESAKRYSRRRTA